MKFLIAIEPGNATTAWGVVVPDLPGCFSAADTLDEVFPMAAEAIDLFVETLIEDDGNIPDPKSLDVHRADPDLAGFVFAYVDVPVEKYLGPAQRINVTVPAVLLERIDRYANAHGESRSGFLVRAAQQVMAVAA